MTPPVDFSPLLDLFREYSLASREDTLYAFDADLAAEARKRIRQICTILSAVHAHGEENKAATREASELSEKGGAQQEALVVRIQQSMELLELFTECFYLFAWRLRQVLRLLPGLNAFEAKGVHTVRNQLIEHPDPKRQPLLPAFSFDHEKGPKLKPFAPLGLEPIDSGLWVNAEEFKSNLELLLSSHIHKIRGSTAP